MFHRNILLGLFFVVLIIQHIYNYPVFFHAITNLVIFLYPLINETYKPPQSFIALHLFEITLIFQYVIKQINNILIADTTTASIIRNGVE